MCVYVYLRVGMCVCVFVHIICVSVFVCVCINWVAQNCNLLFSFMEVAFKYIIITMNIRLSITARSQLARSLWAHSRQARSWIAHSWRAHSRLAHSRTVAEPTATLLFTFFLLAALSNFPNFS